MARRKDAPSPSSGEGVAVPAESLAPVADGQAAVGSDAGADKAVPAEEQAGADAPAATTEGEVSQLATVEIGAPTLLGKDAHVEARTVLAEQGFPQRLRVSNKTPSRLCFPAINALIESRQSVEVTFLSQDHLTSFVTDAQHLCELNGWQNGIVVETLADGE